jgi:hypothetical protein
VSVFKHLNLVPAEIHHAFVFKLLKHAADDDARGVKVSGNVCMGRAQCGRTVKFYLFAQVALYAIWKTKVDQSGYLYIQLDTSFIGTLIITVSFSAIARILLFIIFPEKQLRVLALESPRSKK